MFFKTTLQDCLYVHSIIYCALAQNDVYDFLYIDHLHALVLIIPILYISSKYWISKQESGYSY